jgi:hypothetical protein
MYIWTEGRGGGLFAKQFLILHVCGARGKTKNNIYFELFVFAVIGGIPFVAHQTYWWCALCLFFFALLKSSERLA